MIAWLRSHALALRTALRMFTAHPLAALASLVALASAVALPLAVLSLVGTLQQLAAAFDTDPQLSVVLSSSLAARDRDSLARGIRSRPGVHSVRLVTKEQALAELEATEGVRDVLAGLPSNPLPDMLIVRVGDRGRLGPLQEDLRRLPGVAGVQADAAWVARLDAIIEAMAILTTALALLLAFAVLAVTFNTVRLQIASRRQELAVAALVGATRAWRQRAFLQFGLLQGALAGALAAVSVAALLWLVERELSPLQLSTSWYLRRELALTSVALSALLGWLGARLALRLADRDELLT